MELFKNNLLSSKYIWAGLVRRKQTVYRYRRLSLSRSPRDSEIIRDIRTSTYQVCRIEEQINRIATFYNEYVI